MFAGEELEMMIINKIKKFERNEQLTDENKMGALVALKELLNDIQSNMEDEDENGDPYEPTPPSEEEYRNGGGRR